MSTIINLLRCSKTRNSILIRWSIACTKTIRKNPFWLSLKSGQSVSRPDKYSYRSQCFSNFRLRLRFAGTFMASFVICWRFLSSEDFLENKITCSLAIMSTEGRTQSNASFCSWLTRSSSRKTSSCSGEITSVPASTDCMDFMTNVILCLN